MQEVDAIAKLVPDVLNIKLSEALEKEPRLKELQESRPDVAELIQICLTLEGLPRHASTHAAGVVIADRPLIDYLPLYKGKKGEVVTQFDMKKVEDIGLVKFDFLGLPPGFVIQPAIDFTTEIETEAGAGGPLRWLEPQRNRIGVLMVLAALFVAASPALANACASTPGLFSSSTARVGSSTTPVPAASSTSFTT